MSAEAQIDGRAVISKVTWRLIPFIFISYVIAYLDRVNISFAKQAMQRDLGLGEEVMGLGMGLFFIGYFLFEIPSNLILQRVGARRWIARIMIVWGFVSMGMMFVQGQWSFYALRVALGLAEAGFFPGVVLYLTYWVPARERARVGALFMMAIPVSLAVGSTLSALLLELDGVLGLAGWQWLFVQEGLPAVLLGLLTLRFLTDRPEDAAWLRAEEREWLLAELAKEKTGRKTAHGLAAFRLLLDWRVLLLCLIYFLNNTVTYGVVLWLPTMINEVARFQGLQLGLVNAIPFIAAIAGMVVIGAHSDRTGERRGHVAFCALLGAAGLIMAVLSQRHAWLFVLGFTICQIGQRSIISVFWAIPPIFLGGTAAAAGIALINSIGNLGGHLGPHLMGWVRQRTGGYTGSLLTLAVTLVIVAAIVMSLRLPREVRTPAQAKSA